MEGRGGLEGKGWQEGKREGGNKALGSGHIVYIYLRYTFAFAESTGIGNHICFFYLNLIQEPLSVVFDPNIDFFF